MPTFYDFVGGIGGFRLGMQRAGFECVGYCDHNKVKRGLYAKYFQTKGEHIAFQTERINTGTMPNFDVLTAGFPCPTFSMAGKKQGFNDTRGTVFFDICRVIKVKRPQYLFFENVEGLLFNNKGQDFLTILTLLDELRYNVEWQVLNSKDTGLCQTRKRVYIIGHSRRKPTRQIFPITRQGRHDNRKIIKIGNYLNEDSQSGRVYDPKGLCPTLDAMKGGNRQPKILLNNKIRRLTPLECLRCQGFPDDLYATARSMGISDSDIYEMAGEAVSVPVVEVIAHRLWDNYHSDFSNDKVYTCNEKIPKPTSSLLNDDEL